MLARTKIDDDAVHAQVVSATNRAGETVPPARMAATRFRFVAALVVVSSIATTLGCAYSREGWGRGRFLVVHESPNLQVRRSTIRHDGPNHDLVMNWIGARAPSGRPAIARLSVVVFDDRNENHVPDAGEIRVARHADGPGEKLLFSDVRVETVATLERDPPHARLTMRVEARTVDGSTHASDMPFVPDP